MRSNKANKIKKNKFSISMLIMFILLMAYVIMLLGLMFWAVEASFKEKREFQKHPIGLPEGFYTENYKDAFEMFKVDVQTSEGRIRTVGFGEMIVNSVLYSVGCAFFNTLVIYITAYFCARYKFFFSKIVYGVVVIMMVIPLVGTLPSSIDIARRLNMYGEMWGIWIMSATFLGLYFLVFHDIFKAMPDAYFEAASIDGANDFHLLFKIAVPLTSNAFLTVFLINFIKYWNDYQTPLIYLKEQPVLSYGMYLVSLKTYIPPIMAASVIVLLPVIILFILTNKKLMGNISVGGIKG